MYRFGKNRKRTYRILLDIVLLGGVFFFPWWISLLLATLGIVLFNNFFEAIIAGFLLDVLYGVRAAEFYGVWFVNTLLYSVLFFAIAKIKNYIIFYDTYR